MKYKFPKVGMRMVKTAVAVFICLLITFIRPESVPIYSTITAVLCMQPYLSNTKEIAINRIVGTLIGGLAGMLVLMFMRSYVPWPTVQAHGTVYHCFIVHDSTDLCDASHQSFVSFCFYLHRVSWDNHCRNTGYRALYHCLLSYD